MARARILGTSNQSYSGGGSFCKTKQLRRSLLHNHDYSIPSAAMPGTRGPVPVPLQANGGSTDLTITLLEQLETHDPLPTQELHPHVSQAEIKATLDRLASRSMVEYDTHDKEEVILTTEGQQICDEGSHEYKVWDAVRKAGKLSPKDQAVCALPPVSCHMRERRRAKLTHRRPSCLRPPPNSAKATPSA